MNDSIRLELSALIDSEQTPGLACRLHYCARASHGRLCVLGCFDRTPEPVESNHQPSCQYTHTIGSHDCTYGSDYGNLRLCPFTCIAGSEGLLEPNMFASPHKETLTTIPHPSDHATAGHSLSKSSISLPPSSATPMRSRSSSMIRPYSSSKRKR